MVPIVLFLGGGGEGEKAYYSKYFKTKTDK